MAKRWRQRPEGSSWDELWHLSELADWLPGAVGSPVTPVATV